MRNNTVQVKIYYVHAYIYTLLSMCKDLKQMLKKPLATYHQQHLGVQNSPGVSSHPDHLQTSRQKGLKQNYLQNPSNASPTISHYFNQFPRPLVE